jgi:hypothetical protein
MKILTALLILSMTITLYILTGWLYYAIHGFLYPRLDLLLWMSWTAIFAGVRWAIKSGSVVVEVRK